MKYTYYWYYITYTTDEIISWTIAVAALTAMNEPKAIRLLSSQLNQSREQLILKTLVPNISSVAELTSSLIIHVYSNYFRISDGQ